jgi:hypothetical protein
MKGARLSNPVMKKMSIWLAAATAALDLDHFRPSCFRPLLVLPRLLISGLFELECEPADR